MALTSGVADVSRFGREVSNFDVNATRIVHVGRAARILIS
jgi:hypothetical protein